MTGGAMGLPPIARRIVRLWMPGSRSMMTTSTLSMSVARISNACRVLLTLRRRRPLCFATASTIAFESASPFAIRRISRSIFSSKRTLLREASQELVLLRQNLLLSGKGLIRRFPQCGLWCADRDRFDRMLDAKPMCVQADVADDGGELASRKRFRHANCRSVTIRDRRHF